MSCVTPAYMNILETMALTEKQQDKVQVCERNGRGKLAKRADAQEGKWRRGRKLKLHLKGPRKSGRRMETKIDRMNWRLLKEKSERKKKENEIIVH